MLAALAGWGAGSLVQAARLGPPLVAVVTRNDLPIPLQRSTLIAAGGGALIVAAACILYGAWARADAPERIRRFGRRVAPFALGILAHPLLYWELWRDQPATVLALLSLVALLARPLFQLTFSTFSQQPAPPRAPTERWLRALLRARAYLPLLLVAAGALAYSVYFGHYTVLNHHNLGTYSYDLGIEENIVWNAAFHPNWHLPASPFQGPDSPHLPRHATYIAFVLAPIYALWPCAEMVLWIQATIIGTACIPLFLLARRRLGDWPACVIALGYLLYPPTHGPNLYDFHCLTLGPCFVWWASYLLDARRDRLAAIAVVLALSVREDVAASMAVLGLFFAIGGWRPRAGLVVAAVSTVYFLIMKMVIMPLGTHHQSFEEIYTGLQAPGRSGFSAVLWTLLTNPGFVVQTLIKPDKLVYALQIAAPLAFLPWTRPIGWLCTIPGFLFCLLETNAPPVIQISFQYAVHFIAYAYLALIHNLAPLAQGEVPAAAHDRTRMRAALCAYALAMVLGSYQFGAVLQQNTARGGYGPFVFGTTPQKQELYQALRKVLTKLPPNAKVTASEMLVPHVSNRRYAYTMRTGIHDAEYLLYMPGIGREESKNLYHALKRNYSVVEAFKGISLAKRRE